MGLRRALTAAAARADDPDMGGIVLTELTGDDDDEGIRIMRRASAIEAIQHCGLMAALLLAAEQVRAAGTPARRDV